MYIYIYNIYIYIYNIYITNPLLANAQRTANIILFYLDYNYHNRKNNFDLYGKTQT